MKRLIFTLIVFALMATPVLGTPSLGWWPEEHPRATHQIWEFTNATESVPGSGVWTSVPEDIVSPNPSPTLASITADWDGSGAFTSDTDISLFLEIGNFDDPLAYKEIWVDIGASGVGAPIITSIEAHDGPVGEFTFLVLDGQGDADFGIRIWPNPDIEKISFTLPNTTTPGSGELATLDWIHVDTICIPAPGAIILGSLGVGLVGWLRRRKSL